MHACAMDLQVLATDFSRGALGHVLSAAVNQNEYYP